MNKPKAGQDELPPHSVEAEQGALGCVLLTESLPEKDALLLQLTPDLFYELRHQTLLAEMVALRQDNHVLDSIVLWDWLKGRKKAEICGGMTYIAELQDKTPSVANFDYYLDILKEEALRRRSLRLSVKLKEMASATELTPEQLRDSLAEIYDESARLGRKSDPLIEVVTIKEAKEYVPDPKTFLIGADMICRGDLTLIAGKGGLGKSRLANTLAFAGARGTGEWMGYAVKSRFRTFVLQSENSMLRIRSEVLDVPDEFGGWVKFSKPCALNFEQRAFRMELRRIWEAWPFDCLVIDNWLDVSRAEGQEDYLEALANIRACLPLGDTGPAIVIVAHLRKTRGGDIWRPKMGRSLMDEISGSLALAAKARTVFVIQPGSHDHDDNRIVFDCAKCNNGQPLPESAWYRRNMQFEPCLDFDWDAWMNPPDESARKTVTVEMLKGVFQDGRRMMSRNQAAEAVVELGFSLATAYRHIDKAEKAGRLVKQDGLFRWED